MLMSKLAPQYKTQLENFVDKFQFLSHIFGGLKLSSDDFTTKFAVLHLLWYYTSTVVQVKIK